MSDQAPPEAVDTPTPASPDPGTPGSQQTAEQVQAAIDYQKRYEDLHPEYTKVTQEAAQLREREQWFELLATTDDPDTRRQAAQALGYEVEDEPDPAADPSDALARRLEALEQATQQKDEQAQQQAQLAQIESHVEQQLGQLTGLDKEDQAWVVDRAVRMPPKQTPEGLMVPDIEGAHQAFVAWEQDRQKKWAQTKRTSHRVSPVGEAGSQVPDLDNRQDRIDWMTSQLSD